MTDAELRKLAESAISCEDEWLKALADTGNKFTPDDLPPLVKIGADLGRGVIALLDRE